MERWVWLHINVITEHKPGYVFKCYYVPEKVIARIPSYKADLDEQLGYIDGDSDDDDEPIILEDIVHDQNNVCKALRFLASGYLAPLDASSATLNTIGKFTALYDFSLELEIEDLETAVLGRIDDMDYDALPLDLFMRFARSYYGRHGAESHLTSLGCLIKRKLSYLLPRLEQSMTVDEISSEGGLLGKQLMAVLLEDRAKVRANNGAQDNERAVSEESAARIKVESQECPLSGFFDAY